MNISPENFDASELHKVITSLIVPRPIAWVSTIDNEGVCNLAPFSYFNVVASQPPTFMISVGRRNEIRKDTSKNLLRNGDAVIHLATELLAEKMVQSSAEVSADVDEFELSNLNKIPSTIVSPPRIEASPAAIECTVDFHREVGDKPNDMFLLKAVLIHFADETLPGDFGAIGRLGSNRYCKTTDAFEMHRPR